MKKNVSMEVRLNEGLAMLELEERLEMVQLASSSLSSCCFDSSTKDSVNVSARAEAGLMKQDLSQLPDKSEFGLE